MNKLLNYIKSRLLAFVPSFLGVVEVAIKFIKEVLTLVVDILFPVIPIEKFKIIVTLLRAKVDVVYNWVTKIKEQLLKYIGLV
jgi:hypothetical protein